MKLDLKKIYYYVISLITFFVLLWGTIDFVSAAMGMMSSRYSGMPQTSDKNSEPGLEQYYQTRVAQDRMFDSLARMLISGGVFLYAKYKLNELERS